MRLFRPSLKSLSPPLEILNTRAESEEVKKGTGTNIILKGTKWNEKSGRLLAGRFFGEFLHFVQDKPQNDRGMRLLRPSAEGLAMTGGMGYCLPYLQTKIIIITENIEEGR